MKRLFAGIAAVLAVTGAASAADLDGSETSGYGQRPAIWSGWAITGSVGHARQGYDTERHITRETEKYTRKRELLEPAVPGKEAVAPKCINGHAQTTYKANQGKCFYKDGDKWKESQSAEYVPGEDAVEAKPAVYGELLEEKHYQTFRNAAETFLFDLDGKGLQGGVEVGRRMQSDGWVFEAAVGANFDGNNRDSVAFGTAFDVFDENGDPTGNEIGGEGFLSVKKKRDLYLVARAGHIFGSDERLLLGMGAGISFARFEIEGGHTFVLNPAVPTAFSEDENAFGVVLEAYGRYKLARNWDFGVLGTYKNWGDISASDSASGEHVVPLTTKTKFTESTVTDHVEISPHEWALKGTLTYTFD